VTADGVLFGFRNRGVSLLSSQGRAEAEVGGWYGCLPSTPPDEIVSACREAGVRALSVRPRNIEFLRELPELEFVSVDPSVDIEPVHALPHLRGLSFGGTWFGRLDFGRLPSLEWFFVAEAPANGGLETLYAGHSRIRSVRIGQSRVENLEPFGALPALERLELFVTRALRSLEGASALAPSLTGLELHTCPGLTSLDGIEALQDLQFLSLNSCKQITDLSPLAQLPQLRFLDALQLGRIESLAPLAGHPSLEAIRFPRPDDKDLSPLETMPNLKAIGYPGGKLKGHPAGPVSFIDQPYDDPFIVEMNRLRAG